MVVSDRTEKKLKTPTGMLLVKIQISYRMLTGHHARGATAGKKGLRLPASGLNAMCFEKRNGEKGNLQKWAYLVYLYPKSLEIGPIDGIVFGLIMKYCQRNISKGYLVYSIYFWIKTFKSIQALSILSGFKNTNNWPAANLKTMKADRYLKLNNCSGTRPGLLVRGRTKKFANEAKGWCCFNGDLLDGNARLWRCAWISGYAIY